MSKHSQKSNTTNMICSECMRDCCTLCVDVTLIILGRPTICQCRKKSHSGEPRDQQILDPTTNDVHAPGMTIREDGSIERKPQGA